ncbi:replicative helicase loader/inhibitor [Neobacillus jeddahensis]|uniref:replicative helicase loader/inhibitor n=1 Tax=Neobacillus jeddahensis TaxID=1461580 RepID=UPI0005A74186|nr:replicative helicase loader/inhibitor [Neobacillus jeddahensis]
MDKKDVGQLLNYLNVAYPNFLRDNKPETVLDFWFRSLKDFEYEKVLDNLVDYAQTNDFPPKIKDLVAGLMVNEKYNIPGIEETKKIMEGYQVPEEHRLSHDEIKVMFKRQFSDDGGEKND